MTRDLASRARPRAAIIGAGVAGIAMANRLKAAGIDYVCFERGSDVGGTWHLHSYPGLCIDVHSHVYSYSFAPNPHWTQAFPSQPEMQRYFRRVADEFGVTSHVRFQTAVVEARWSEDRWEVRLADGAVEHFDFLVSAQGFLNEPATPDFPGRATFPGMQFHSAHWPVDLDLRGKRVAIVGSAASAVQIAPEIAPIVAELTLFQRTPNWMVPKNNGYYTARDQRRFERWPLLQRLHRLKLYLQSRFILRGFLGHRATLEKMRQFSLDYMHATIKDPELRRNLTPSFDPGCKRMLLTDAFYPTLLRSNVRFIASAVDRIEGDEVVATSGDRVRVDVIIFCTGYKMPNYQGSVNIVGLQGSTLAEHMRRAPEAYKGVAVPGFPNFFLINGPNGALGYTSVIMGAEMQTEYIERIIRKSIRAGTALQVALPVHRKWNDAIQAKLAKTSWAGNCLSYYHDVNGRVWTFFPGSARQMRQQYRVISRHEFQPVAIEDVTSVRAN